LNAPVYQSIPKKSSNQITWTMVGHSAAHSCLGTAQCFGLIFILVWNRRVIHFPLGKWSSMTQEVA